MSNFVPAQIERLDFRNRKTLNHMIGSFEFNVIPTKINHRERILVLQYVLKLCTRFNSNSCLLQLQMLDLNLVGLNSLYDPGYHVVGELVLREVESLQLDLRPDALLLVEPLRLFHPGEQGVQGAVCEFVVGQVQLFDARSHAHYDVDGSVV